MIVFRKIAIMLCLEPACRQSAALDHGVITALFLKRGTI